MERRGPHLLRWMPSHTSGRQMARLYTKERAVTQAARIEVEGEKAHAQQLWTETPCGSLEGDRTTAEYFAAVDRDRYVRYAPWLPDVMQFERFRGCDVVEIGFGQGTDLMQFARAGARSLAGLDLSSAHLELATRRFGLAGLSADLRLHDAESTWPFPDASKDVVYSFGVLHHTPNPERALAQAYRVLRPGGVILIGLYHRHSLVTARHWLKWLLRRGWRAESYEKSWWRIEGHREDTAARPLVNRYSRQAIRKLVAGAKFTVRRLAVDHAAIHTHPAGRLVPRPIIRAVDRTLGWYVIAEGVKA